MNNKEPVGKFQFGGNSIESDKTGAFSFNFAAGAKWDFDLGEITRFSEIIRRIHEEQIKPTEQEPETFWRTNGTKVLEIWTTFGNYNRIHIREGGKKEAYFWIEEIPEALRFLRILTEGAPYHRIARLLDVIEKQRDEILLRIETFPLNNRKSKNTIKVEKEFTQEMIRTINVEASFGIGLDYWIATNLEARFGLTKEQRISERVTVSMEASPGEHIEYQILWKEVVVAGDAIFEINGIKEKVPFKLKSNLIPDIRHELIARD